MQQIKITRKYSLAEIDQMRNDFYWRRRVKNYLGSIERSDIEEELRTYMMAGGDPEELRKTVADSKEKYNRRLEAVRKKFAEMRAQSDSAPPNRLVFPGDTVTIKRKWWQLW